MSTLFSLLQKVKPVIVEPPSPQAAWRDVGLDSLDQVELAARIEQRYRIEIPDADWNRIHCLAELESYLSERLAGHG